MSETAIGIPRPDVAEVLRRYRELLRLVEAPLSSLGGERADNVSDAFLGRRISKSTAGLQIRWGAYRFTVEHVRSRVDVIGRCYDMRLALAEEEGNDAPHRESVARFAAALPRPVPRVWLLLAVLGTLGVAQVLVAAVGTISGERATFRQASQVADLNPTHFNDAAYALLHSSFSVGWDLLGVVTLSVYLVLRPFVPGFRLARLARHAPGAEDWWNAGSPLAERAAELAVYKHETALLAALGARPPRDLRLDLAVKALFAALWLEVGVDSLFVPADRNVIFAIGVLVAAGARLRWLLQQWRQT